MSIFWGLENTSTQEPRKIPAMVAELANESIQIPERLIRKSKVWIPLGSTYMIFWLNPMAGCWDSWGFIGHRITEWQSYRVTEWQSDRVTELQSDIVTEWQSDRHPRVLSIRVGEIFLCLISINSPTRFACRGTNLVLWMPKLLISKKIIYYLFFYVQILKYVYFGVVKSKNLPKLHLLAFFIKLNSRSKKIKLNFSKGVF